MNGRTVIAAVALATLAGAAQGLRVVAVADEPVEVEVTAETFGCIRDMTPVRHFYVDNLAGDLEATLAVANSPTGGKYPPGSVVQLIPTEVMVKHGEGWNAATRDWEFFELEVSRDGSRIVNRGFADVVNRFGGNCFACHVRARPEWDLICEKDHGCDPVPVSAEQILELQRTDPRCGTAPAEQQ
ncbi:MAG: hypothetical protein OEW35_09600 [Gammaproteobacteria bacterium]|nr:hypothetical protein [Gammaproteobacteria bacterium]MDH4255842.1 hypothetical protein [Gammaproteobacteria bacterium]MDH5309304.1 hypothetical protein [Gammaproteobacteria bacterium]